MIRPLAIQLGQTVLLTNYYDWPFWDEDDPLSGDEGLTLSWNGHSWDLLANRGQQEGYRWLSDIKYDTYLTLEALVFVWSRLTRQDQ